MPTILNIVSQITQSALELSHVVAHDVLSAFGVHGSELVREAEVDVVQKPRLVSVLSDSGEGEVFEEWVGEASVCDFEIVPQPSERLCSQKT